ncbi:MAG TPA: hypothetical protein VFX30_10910, partial [bacterium]|nr:hypothetical protein [bacterium]
TISETSETQFKLSLPSSSPRYWAVQPKGPAPYYELGTISSIRKVIPDNQKTKPALHLPLSSVPYHGLPVTFIWKKVSGAATYRVVVYNKTATGACNTASVFWDNLAPGVNFNSGFPDYIGVEIDQDGIAGSPADKSGKCWTVTAIGSDGTAGVASDLGSYAIGPSKPVLLSPAKNATDVDFQPTTLSWQNEWTPNGYTLHVLEQHMENGFTIMKEVGGGNTSSTQMTLNLKPSTSYHWNVEARGTDTTNMTKSASSDFTTEQGCTPIASAPGSLSPGLTGVDELDNVSEYVCYVQPQNTQSPYTPYYRLQWQPVAGATSYQVKVYSFGNGSTVFSQEYTAAEAANGVVVPHPPQQGQAPYEYGWEVRAKNSCMSSYGPASALRYYECFACFTNCGGYPVAPH